MKSLTSNKKMILSLILLLIVLLPVVFYIISLYPEAAKNDSMTNNTTPFSSSTISTQSRSTITSSTGINIDEDYNTVLRELWNKSISMNIEGYDVIYAQYLLLSSKYYYLKGNINKAWELLKDASNELDNAVLRPELSQLEFDVMNNTLYINREPTPWDFIPIGTVFALSDKGYLVYPRNDPKWKLSCFIIIAVGKDSYGRYFAYQGRLPLAPWEGRFRPRIFINGEWHVLDIVFAGPLYYDDGKLFNYPTVYQYDTSGNILQYITYVPDNRTWIHKIIDLEDNRALLSINAHVISAPMWIGEWNSSYIIHGIYAETRDADLWSGFWDICEMEAKLYYMGSIHMYQGFFIFDRASHRVYLSGSAYNVFGPPLSFSCMVIYQDGLNIMISSSVNPSPWNPGYPTEHQIRIYIQDKELTIDITNFQLYDDGSIQPSKFILYGEFEDGYINLTGEVISYWPTRWIRGHGTWWDKDGVYAWGRAFIHWTGVIVYNDLRIDVNAIGAGEFTRYSCISNGDFGDNGEDGCWCK